MLKYVLSSPWFFRAFVMKCSYIMSKSFSALMEMIMWSLSFSIHVVYYTYCLCISNTEFFICRISSFSQFPCWIFLPFDEFSSMCLTVSSILLNFLYVTVFPFQVLDWLHLIVCVLSQVIDHFTRKLLQSSSGILTISVFLSSVVVSCELLEESCCFPSSYSLHLLAEMACLFIF